MKVTTQVALIIGTLLVSQMAMADDHRKHRHGHKHGKHHSDRHYSDRHYNRGYDDRRYHRKHRRGDVLRLDIPVHVRGTARIGLRRAVRDYYNIDLSQYQLRKVVVHNRGHRDGYAKLKTGHQRTERIPLSGRRTHIRAPRHADGAWVLKLRRAKVDNIRVVLEPRSHYYANRYDNHHGRAKHHDRSRHHDRRKHHDRPRHHDRPTHHDDELALLDGFFARW